MKVTLTLIGFSQAHYKTACIILDPTLALTLGIPFQISYDTETQTHALDAEPPCVIRVNLDGDQKGQLGNLRILKGTLADVFGSMVRAGFPNSFNLEVPQFLEESAKFFEPKRCGPGRMVR